MSEQLEERARELLAAEYDRDGSKLTAIIQTLEFDRLNPPEQRAIRAIVKALSPPPSDTRNNVLEEAARVAEARQAIEIAKSDGAHTDTFVVMTDYAQAALRGVAEAIRALKSVVGE